MARILLADDDKGSLELVRRALEIDGHNVVAREDGNEALAAFAPGRFDLLVADVQMPGLDGIELARRVLAASPGTRLLLMSGYADVLEQAKGLGSPSLRLVTKPFSIDRIRSEVKAALA